VLAGGLAYYETPSFFLSAVNQGGEAVLDKYPFPSASGEVRVQLLWPREKDFVAALFWPGEREVADGSPPGTEPAPAQVTVLKAAYGKTRAAWRTSHEGTPRLSPLFLPDQNRLALALDEVVRIDVDGQKGLPGFKLPVAEAVDWSVDRNETYCMIGYEAGKKVLVACSSKGEELWRWSAGDKSADAWVAGQPPVQAGDGRVYALAEKHLYAFRDGKLTGKFGTRDTTYHRATALSDGTILVTAGNVLYHLGTDGQVRVSVELDKRILSSPVVDGQGHVYVATETHLVRID
jgi:hypothetical protein